MTLGAVNLAPLSEREVFDRPEVSGVKRKPQSLLQIALDAVTTNTSVGSFVESTLYDMNPMNVHGGTPLELTTERILGTPFEMRPDLLIGVQTEEQFAQRLEYLQRRASARERLAESGALGVALSLGSNLLDPLNYIGFGSAALVRGRGITNLLRTAGRAAGGAVAGAAATEAVLQATDPLATAEESALSVGAGVAFGGVLGALGGVVSMKRLARANRMIDDFVDPEAGFVVMGKDGRAFEPNERVATELRGRVDRGERLRREDIEAIYQQHGTEIEAKSASGRVAEDGSILISRRDLNRILDDSGDILDNETAATREADDMAAARQEKIQEDLDFARSVQARYDVEGC